MTSEPLTDRQRWWGYRVTTDETDHASTTMSTTDDWDSVEATDVEPNPREAMADLEFEPVEFDASKHGLCEGQHWMESPEHSRVYFLVEQGINFGLANATADFADALADLPFAFGVTWSVEMKRPHWFDIDYEKHVIVIDVNKETAVWNFDVVFRQIAFEILGQIRADGVYNDPLPICSVEEYTGESIPESGWWP